MRNKIILGILAAGFCLFSACTKPVPDSEPRSEIITEDNVILIGKFVPPKTPEKLTFILLHGLASGKEEWYGFVEKLSSRGYGYLAVDMRGHGESNKTKSGKEVDIKFFGPPGPGSEWDRMTEDVDCMVKYLDRKRNIQKNTIALAGASIGANIVLKYAVRHKFIPLTVLLSPGLNYAGLLTAPAMLEYDTRPVAIASSPKDEYAYASSARLLVIAKEAGANVAVFEGEKNQHGTQMFDGKFENKLLDWVDSACRQ